MIRAVRLDQGFGGMVSLTSALLGGTVNATSFVKRQTGLHTYDLIVHLPESTESLNFPLLAEMAEELRDGSTDREWT